VLEVSKRWRSSQKRSESKDTPYGNTFKALIKEDKRIYK